MYIPPFVKRTLRRIDKYSPYPVFSTFEMTKAEKIMFKKNIENSGSYLEFGMGGSTIYALKNSDAKIYSVESSKEWIKHMREYFYIRNSEKTRLKLFQIDIGETKEWGHPVGEESKEKFPDYSGKIFESLDTQSLDSILVDGRFRVACALKAALECKGNEKLRVMIHDFWNREKYHKVLEYLEECESVDKLVVLKLKNDIDLEQLQKEYDIYKFISD